MIDEEIDGFSLDEFKSWMKTNGGNYVPGLSRKTIGAIASPRVSPNKLISKMSLEEGDLEEIAKDFKRGGKVIGVDGNSLLIEVKSGTFFIPKQYVIVR